ncbi:protein Mis18-beta-like [Xenopus laevis]|uniref:Protein Mis18-beta-like n=1 Tax=Xenopus laevis TaxID=8355 RepID=A0A8J1LLC0_XENLA|nr:protein Mis18-beta-like [Xenopus laevis]
MQGACEESTVGLEQTSDRSHGKLNVSWGRAEGCVLFLCNKCYSVLGDSLSVCGDEESLGAIACLRVTEDLNVGESVLFVVEGNLKGCAYYSLVCRSCGTNIGFNLYSAPRAYAFLRGLFCLLKEHILCYKLKCSSLVPGNEMHFEFPSLDEDIAQLKTQLVQLHLKMELISQQLLQQEKNTGACL